MAVFALSFHADYRCARSGVCCSSDWDVPVELPVYRSLHDAVERGRLVPAAAAHDGGPPLITGDDLPDDATAMLARTSSGDCVFYHRHSGLCVVHRDAGEAALPATCRHFPRLTVRDARGTFLSLTHFCPTAAASLFRPDAGISIVENPIAFPLADYDGLTVAADEWPPLLHRRMLMDLAGYSAWEQHMVARCADASASPEDVLATLRRDAATLVQFVPGGGTLSAHVRALPLLVERSAAPHTLDAQLSMRDTVVRAIPDDLKPHADERGLSDAYRRHVRDQWSGWRVPLNRYIAAKAFANWTAYQGRGILAIVRGLETAVALVRVEAARLCRDANRDLDGALLKEAIRAADFMLNHLAVGEDLAASWSREEEAA